MLTCQGQTLSIYEWARKLGTEDQTLRTRIDTLGWTVEEALTTPIKHREVRTGGTAFLLACEGKLTAEEYLALTEEEEYGHP